ncbi:protease inhibitor-like [Musca autumnalis]|uniref:protease inhibitor-like n=1 Tax=Musca autumnalis TaxID=221902 RepID=UPI003CF2F1CB
MKFVLVILSIIVVILALAKAFDKADCSLPKEVGPCRKAEMSYYFDADSKSCQSFFYGGCHGNNNRFDSKEQCEKSCL